MTSTKCSSDGLLASVSELDFNPKLRIPFPLGGEGERGVYGPITNGQRIARHLAPEVLKGVGVLSAALLRDGALDAALRELIIVRVGYLAASAYEVVQHRSLAERLGVLYVRRSDHLHAKAGNVNHALQFSDADFVTVFDVDHIPEPHFLDTVLGHFDDP